MVRSRVGLKALGLCAMLVGMLAFASVAHAEKGSFWLVSGAKISESLLPTVLGKTDVEGVLLTELGGKQIHLKCPTFETVGAHLVEPEAKILGKLLFKGCKFFELVTPGGTLKEVAACTPTAGGVKGNIETNSITGEVVLHEPSAGVKEAVVKAVPTAGTIFATISLGELCAFGELLKIEGTFYLKDCKGAALTDLKEHLVEELKSLTSLTVNGGKTKATIDGSALAALGGAHAGLTFAAHAG